MKELAKTCPPACGRYSSPRSIRGVLLGAGSPDHTAHLRARQGDSREAEQVALALSFFSIGMAFVSVNTLLQPGFLQHSETLAAADHRCGEPGPQRRLDLLF